MLKKISSTIFLQAINTALPFITIPYYVRKLGVDGYGQIGVAIAVIQYLLMCVDFGFTLPSIRAVAKAEKARDEATKLFSNITTAKFAIMVSGIILLSLLSILFNTSIVFKNLICIGLLLVLGQTLTPNWLFIGREKSELFLLINIIPKALVIPLIILFVNNPDDIELAMFLQVLPCLATAFFAIYYIKKEGWIDFSWPNIIEIKNQFKLTWPLFISSAATSVYTSSTPIILNTMCGAHSVGVFMIADKIRQGIQAIATPISLVIYPKIVKKFSISNRNSYIAIKRLSIFLIGGVSIVAFLFFTFSGNIISLIFGANTEASIYPLKILSLATIPVFFNIILGTYILIPMGYEKIYSRVVLRASFFHLFLTTFLISIFDYDGAAFGIMGVEIFMTIGMVYLLMHTHVDNQKKCYKGSIAYDIVRA